MLRRFRWRLEDGWRALEDMLKRWYHHSYWGCRRGNHWMKMSGCVYCGRGGSQQVRLYI